MHPANQYAANLMSEFPWDGLVAKNRVVMSPMTRGRAGETNTANTLIARFYAQRASAGVIITEGTFISKEAIGWNHAPGIWTDAQGEAWKQVVNAVHEYGQTLPSLDADRGSDWLYLRHADIVYVSTVHPVVAHYRRSRKGDHRCRGSLVSPGDG